MNVSSIQHFYPVTNDHAVFDGAQHNATMDSDETDAAADSSCCVDEACALACCKMSIRGLLWDFGCHGCNFFKLLLE